MDPLTTIGSLLTGNEQRDAIHIAVAPVIAGAELAPGTHVGFIESNQQTVGVSSTPIGVVDPYLSRAVRKGERFWMFLYPNSIKSIRHEWSHPAFLPVVLSDSEQKAASEAWLRDFIARSDCPDYHTVIGAAVSGGSCDWSDEYLHFNGRDAHGDIPAEFWDHVEIVTGQKITERPSMFSCSC